MDYQESPRACATLAPTIAQYQNYQDLLKHSEQVPLHEFQQLGAGEMPRFAEGLFDQPPGPGLRRKRKKLADFSQEEKQARRKLKNRIAAQSARDRKRVEAEMQCKSLDNLELEVERLRAENTSLRQENSSLRHDNSALRNENNELRQDLNDQNGHGKRKRMQEMPKREYSESSYYSSPGSSSQYQMSPPYQNPSPTHVSFHTESKAMPLNSNAQAEPLQTMSNCSARTAQKLQHASPTLLVDPLTVVEPNTVTLSPVQQQSSNPADGLMMSQGREEGVTSRRSHEMEVIRVEDSKRCEKIQAVQTMQADVARSAPAVQALYTLVLTILFQMSGRMMDSRMNSNNNGSRRMRTVMMLKRIEQARAKKASSLSLPRETSLTGLPAPITLWESHGLAQSPLAKAQTTRFSTTSSKSCPKTEAIEQRTTVSMKTLDSLTGGKAQATQQTPPTAIATACPMHVASSANCLACQCKQTKNVQMSDKHLLMLNMADHMLRQAVEQKRRAQRQQAARQQVLRRSSSQDHAKPTQAQPDLFPQRPNSPAI